MVTVRYRSVLQILYCLFRPPNILFHFLLLPSFVLVGSVDESPVSLLELFLVVLQRGLYSR